MASEMDPEQPDESDDQTARMIGPQPVPTVPSAAPAPLENAAATQRPPTDAGWLRLVIVAWCFWLLGAWGVAWLSDTSVPRVRWMLFAGSFGLMLVWPAFRLSEAPRPGRSPRGDAGTILLDWLGLILVYQAVIWSLHLMAMWPLARGLWLDAAVVAWSLLSALIVAGARRYPGALARSVGMLLCIALVFAEPAAIWLANLAGHEGWLMRISPIQALWELTEPPSRGAIHAWGVRICVVGLVAVAGWLSLGAWALGERLVRRRR